MKRLAILLLPLVPLAALRAAVAPALIEPADDAVLTMSIPHLQWQRHLEPKVQVMPAYDIQIASDDRFTHVVDEDRLAAVIGWYVPDKELAPGEYWWRVANVAASGQRGDWSATRKFSMKEPQRVVTIAKGANFAEIQRAFAEAAKQTPAVVRFEKAAYRLDPGQARTFIDFAAVTDLVVDGGGASITFTHPVGLVHLTFASRVLIKNFTFDFDPPAYTAGRVIAVDSKRGEIEAEILPGHALPDAWPAYRRDTKGMVVSEAEGSAMKRDIPLVVSHDGFERMEGRRYRFRFASGKIAALFSIGDLYVLDPRRK